MDWFIANKGFSVDQAIDVINAIQSFQNEKINETIKDMASRAPDEWSFLSAYTFKSEEMKRRQFIASTALAGVASVGLAMNTSPKQAKFLLHHVFFLAKKSQCYSRQSTTN